MHNQSKPDEINARLDRNRVIIEIPLESLALFQSQRNVVIDDPQVMGEYLADNVLVFSEDVDGWTAFDRMINDLIDQAIEDGEDWLHEWNSLVDDGDDGDGIEQAGEL
jgi:hypothetical protein